ncbi:MULTISPECIES: SRPBCC family protein [unclassified Kribbella]|uniref:SRPBCC family protein n=1 Tax=unclassified Kribbella TaxID=2644121 RepID=UPI003015F4ED
MKLEHKFVVPTPVEQAWAAFNDLERVVPCFPGATLTSYDGDEFSGTCKVKLGPVSLQYAGTGTFVERDPADHHAVVEAKGKDRRGNSTASVRVIAHLDASGETATAVTVETDLTVTGRPAQFGRGLIQDVSDHLLAQFVTCLTTTLTTHPPTPEPIPTPASTPPSSGPTPASPSPSTAEPASVPASTPPTATEPGPVPASTSPGAAASASAASAASAASEPSVSATLASPAGPVSPAGPATPAGPGGAVGTAVPAGGASPAPASTAPTASGSTPSGPAASSTPRAPAEPAPPTPPSPPTPPTPPSEPSAGASTLDLGAALVPALARRLRPYLIGAVLALLIRRLLRR